MLETVYRPVEAELEIMRAEAGGSNGRTVFGILVPWNHPMWITPEGRTQLLRDDTAGLYGEWRVSATPAGDELIELIKDGVYRELSVGFRAAPQWSRRLPDGTLSRTRFDPFEAAAVLRGAYADAAFVGGVRGEDDGPDELSRARLARGRAALAGWPLVRPAGVAR
jgi:HK97 family phage prohead protease